MTVIIDDKIIVKKHCWSQVFLNHLSAIVMYWRKCQFILCHQKELLKKNISFISEVAYFCQVYTVTCPHRKYIIWGFKDVSFKDVQNHNYILIIILLMVLNKSEECFPFLMLKNRNCLTKSELQNVLAVVPIIISSLNVKKLAGNFIYDKAHSKVDVQAF